MSEEASHEDDPAQASGIEQLLSKLESKLSDALEANDQQQASLHQGKIIDLLLKMNRLDDAMQRAESGVKSDPTASRPHTWLAQCLLKRDEFGKALEHALQATMLLKDSDPVPTQRRIAAQMAKSLLALRQAAAPSLAVLSARDKAKEGPARVRRYSPPPATEHQPKPEPVDVVKALRCGISGALLHKPVTHECGYSFSGSLFAAEGDDSVPCPACGMEFRPRRNIVLQQCLEQLDLASSIIADRPHQQPPSAGEMSDTQLLNDPVETAMAIESKMSQGDMESAGLLVQEAEARFLVPKTADQRATSPPPTLTLFRPWKLLLTIGHYKLVQGDLSEGARLLFEAFTDSGDAESTVQTVMDILCPKTPTAEQEAHDADQSSKTSSGDASAVSSADAPTMQPIPKDQVSGAASEIAQALVPCLEQEESMVQQRNMAKEAEALLASCQLDASSMECQLCFNLLLSPVATPCGHTFCHTCLSRALDHRPVCPACRANLEDFLARHRLRVTHSLDVALRFFLEEETNQRRQSEQEEAEQLSEQLPIFVCAPAVPGCKFPLHVFEPRYRLMMRRCVENGTNLFGMCAHTGERPYGYANVGTALKILDHALTPDGRSFVDAIGTRRFAVKERDVLDGYHVAKVEWFDDTDVDENGMLLEDPNGIAATARTLIGGLRSRLGEERFEQVCGTLGGPPESDAQLSFWFATLFSLPDGFIMNMLRSTSARERLQAVVAMAPGSNGCQIM